MVSARRYSLDNKACYFCKNADGKLNIIYLTGSRDIVNYFYHPGCSYKAVKEAHPNYYRDRYRKNGEPYPEKRKIWTQAKYRIKRLACEICGDTNTHRHHPDYSKPLEVRLLCPQHHKQAHKIGA